MHRISKRALLALIITIVTVISANKYWFVVKPISVDFDIKANGTYNIEAQLNRKDDDKFTKSKYAKKELKLNDEEYHANIQIRANRIKFPKRFRLVIDCTNTTPIEIKNISLKDGKYKFNDLSKFALENQGGGIVKVVNNKLIIYPQNNAFILTYKDTLKMRATMKFDAKVLIIIAVLTFLLTYKLTNYVANFNTLKNEPRTEVVFLAIFFILLFIPMCKISQEEISPKENRTLAKWYPLINSESEINFKFGDNFNSWFNDRFYLRDKLVDLNIYLTFALSRGVYKNGTTFFNKNDYWAFDSRFVGTTSFDKQFKIYEKKLQKLNDLCKRNNVKLYIFLAPAASEIYPDEFSRTTGVKNIKYNGENFANYMKAQNLDFVISPLKELQAQKSRPIYTKGDVHWNEEGAFIAYNKLICRIKKDFPSFQILNEKDFTITNDIYSKTDYNNYPTKGCLYNSLNVSKKYLKTLYKHFVFKDINNISTIKINGSNYLGDTSSYYKNAKNKLTVLMIGNSYEENLADFMIPSFTKVIKIRRTDENEDLDIQKIKNYIDKYKPDIFISEFMSYEVPSFLLLYRN